jgi:hypothetical protein
MGISGSGRSDFSLKNPNACSSTACVLEKMGTRNAFVTVCSAILCAGGPVTLFQDLQYSTRLMRRAPLFTAAAVATLALGLGLNSAVLSLANSLFFKGCRSTMLPAWSKSIGSVKTRASPLKLRCPTRLRLLPRAQPHARRSGSTLPDIANAG